MPSLLQDLRYALRRMRRSPGFTLAAVLTLGLGMGVNTAVFSLVEAVLLRPLPYPEAERLVRLWAVNAQEGQDHANLNPLDMADYQRRARSFADLAGISLRSFAVTGGTGEPERVRGALVVPGYFRTLGIEIRQGRGFRTADAAGGPPVAVVNETLARGLWPGRNPVGRRITLDFERAVPHTIIGVARDVHHFGLAAPAAPEVYVSHLQHPASGMTLVVRARRDPAALAGAVRGVVRGLDRQLPAGRGAAMETMEELIAGSVAEPRLRAGLLALFAGLALALAAVGVFGVTGAVVAHRRQEIAVHMALGADRGAVLRLILGRTLIYTAAGLALGLGASLASGRLLAGFLFGVGAADPWVYLISCAVLALVALAAGYQPAVRASRMEPAEVMKADL